MQSTHDCLSDSLYLLLCGHVSSMNSKDTTKWFHILCHRTLTKQQPYLVNQPWLQTNQRTWDHSLRYLLLRDSGCSLCPLSKVSVVKPPRDAKARNREHQPGSNESVSTFQKAWTFAYLLQLQRSQRSMQKACILNALVTCFSGPSWSYRRSTTSLREPHLPTPTPTGSLLAWENPS